MRWLLILIFFLVSAVPARAATDVWLFYGAGPHIFSTGIDTIARWARHTRGVTSVNVSDYRDTQRAYDFLHSRPSDHRIVLVGYSCGSNSSLVVGGALTRQVHLALLQPSFWCGRYPATANMRLLQQTYSFRTFGLGMYTAEGPAQRIVNIDRPERHLRGDNNRDYQRDALAVVTATANPDRWHFWYHNRLDRTTDVVRRRGNTTWREEI